MTLPSFVFGCLVASFLGAGFHLWRGGNLGRLILYILLAWIGFWVGHFIGDALGWSFGSIGPLRLGMALLGTLLTLGLGYWLSLIKKEG
jgi:hypothetical protein